MLTELVKFDILYIFENPSDTKILDDDEHPMFIGKGYFSINNLLRNAKEMCQQVFDEQFIGKLHELYSTVANTS